MSTKKRMAIAVLCLAAYLSALPIPQAKAADVDVSSASSSVMPLMEYISKEIPHRKVSVIQPDMI